jgi:hypothetical protein
MKPPLPLLFAVAASLSFSAVAAATPPAHQLYAAVAMTKAQKNSSTPTDAGLYVRDSAGNWDFFGPRVLGVTGIVAQPGSAGKVLLIGCADGILRSPDAGKTWRKTTGWDTADVRGLAFELQNPGAAYASTAWGPLRSTDGGATWQLAQTGLAKLYCQTLVTDPRHSGRVLLGTEDGIYLSTDAAHTWARTASPATTVLRLARSVTAPDVILAGTQARGAWISRDNGTTWAATDPASAQANLYAADIDPANGAHLAVGGWAVGVRVSSDGGRTWTDRTAGLPAKNVFVLAFDPDVKGRLWASTFEEGTCYSDDLGLSWHDGGLYGAYGFDFAFLPATP